MSLRWTLVNPSTILMRAWRMAERGRERYSQLAMDT